MQRNLFWAFLSVFVLIAVCACLLFFHPLSFRAPATPAPGVAVASSSAAVSPAPIRFEIVDTEAAQERGLGGRAEIPDNYGMLFVFPTAGKYGFWMKDMLVPIDIIWLSDNGTILSILGSVSPATYPNVFYPPTPGKYVLETRAGFAHARGWSVGTQVPLPASVLK